MVKQVNINEAKAQFLIWLIKSKGSFNHYRQKWPASRKARAVDREAAESQTGLRQRPAFG